MRLVSFAALSLCPALACTDAGDGAPPAQATEARLDSAVAAQGSNRDTAAAARLVACTQAADSAAKTGAEYQAAVTRCAQASGVPVVGFISDSAPTPATQPSRAGSRSRDWGTALPACRL